MLNIRNKHFQNILSKTRTPAFVFDLGILTKNLHDFKKLFPGFKIFYSVKTNPLNEIVKTLKKKDINFDAATTGEIKLLLNIGLQPSKILFTHPIKLPATITKAVKYGVENFTLDTAEELTLLMKNAPKKKYLLRILPPVEGTFYKYSDKFGASKNETQKILNYAVRNSIKIHGLSFHVGSQNMSLQPWIETLDYCKFIIDKFYKKLPSLRVVNIGGGFPFPYSFTKCIKLKEIADTVRKLIQKFPKDVEFWAEPGRVLVADTGVVICTVLRKIKRQKNNWIFIDMGIYHGLIEVLESNRKLVYKFESYKNGKLEKYNIAGNTLDPDDTIATNIYLPGNIEMADKIVIHNIGAYTTSFFTNYHALPKPLVYYIID